MNQYTPGRVDWMPRRKVWKVVGYDGRRDIEVGFATTQEAAYLILNDWYESNKYNITQVKAI